MFLDIIFYIILISFAIRSIFKTISVVKAVFKNEKDNMLSFVLDPNIIKR